MTVKHNKDADKIAELLKLRDNRTIGNIAAALQSNSRYVHSLVMQMPGFYVTKDSQWVGNYTVRLAPKLPPAPTGTPDRVTIEITAKGYKTTVLAGNCICSEREMVRDRPGGGAHATKPGQVHDDLPDFKDLAEAVDDSDPFNIMIELDNLSDERR